MIWFAIATVLVILLQIKIRTDKTSFFFGLFVANLGAFLFAHTFMIDAPWKWSDTYYTTKLVSLRSGDGVSGSFWLGNGNIESTGYYFYYVRVDKGYKLFKLSAEKDVTIIEEKRTDGELREYIGEVINPISLWWISPRFPKGREKYEFVIPEGSLKQNFSVQ